MVKRLGKIVVFVILYDVNWLGILVVKEFFLRSKDVF